MIVLGIGGGAERADESAFSRTSSLHDASATLVRNGEIVAAVEEERFNRVKHSGKLPVGAIGYCLAAAAVELEQIDKFVFNTPETDLEDALEAAYQKKLVPSRRRPRAFIQQIFKREFGVSVNPHRFEFIHHHYAHAASAFLPSGFEESLVVTFDGTGSGLSGSVWLGKDARLAHVRNFDGLPGGTTQSLGHLYEVVTVYLGFTAFDEYKVMGLAPYGDPSRFLSLFADCYTLRDGGDYEIFLERMDALRSVGPRRRPHEPIEQRHMDIAAALQQTVETIARHVLRFYRRSTGMSRLCLAGGVAHNCAMNGAILRDGLFDEVFVQPASHDGGLSLGAALHGYCSATPAGRRTPHTMSHAYLGPSCGDDCDIERELSRWRACLDYERVDRIDERAADRIAAGLVVGWVQGRTEFGPRALGSRSIVADPRPAANKDLINAMIKKREAFRPFAPSVLEECADRYFELPSRQSRLPFMVFVVRVREEFRSLLGAVTHVDGTARIQTVSRSSNEMFWSLIDAFGRKTGVPIVLNTSFNNNAEPIVMSARDAIVCYLTTGLDCLVIGNFLVSKKSVGLEAYAEFMPSLAPHVRLHERWLGGSGDGVQPPAARTFLYQDMFATLRERDADTDYCLGNTHDRKKVPISSAVAAVLEDADGFTPLNDLLTGIADDVRLQVLRQLVDLWATRAIHLSPPSV